MVLQIEGDLIAGIVGFPDPWLFEQCGPAAGADVGALDIDPLSTGEGLSFESRTPPRRATVREEAGRQPQAPSRVK